MGLGTLRRHYNTRRIEAAPSVDPAARLEAELETERARSARLAAELEGLKVAAVEQPPPAPESTEVAPSESDPEPAVPEAAATQPARGGRRTGR